MNINSQLNAENINGTNIGVPQMEDVISMVLKRMGADYIDSKTLATKRPDIVSWYEANKNSKNKKVQALIKKLQSCIIRIREVVESIYTGHDESKKGTIEYVTFCFSVLKKEILDIVLI